MKVLHTADWHLGHKFFQRSRVREQRAALQWLSELIVREGVELLVIAGDVFDTDNPPNVARELYFDFLKRLVGTCCQAVVVIGGNHDSANMLEATRPILELLNVYVIGSIPEKREQQLLPIRHQKTGELLAVVAAVPYLRDRDVRQSVAGEGHEQGIMRLKAGIQQHYQEMAEVAAPYADQGVPIIATGHLYAAGGERGERPDLIHIGYSDVIHADSFSTLFDYVALGHLHRCQQIDSERPIWYSGTLIPLDFSELNYQQSVCIVEFDGKKIARQTNVPVPLTRKLRTFKGSPEYLKETLKNLSPAAELPTWLRLIVETNEQQPYLRATLDDLLASDTAEILQLRLVRTGDSPDHWEDPEQVQSLNDLSEMEVFRLAIQQQGGVQPPVQKALENSFTELLNWMQERDDH